MKKPDPRNVLQEELERRRRSGRESAIALEHAQIMAEAKEEYKRIMQKPEAKWPLGARAKQGKKKALSE